MKGVVRQRAELTFKHNMRNGRHGWLRLTPAYSLKLVDDRLEGSSGHVHVFDPFCGTGTTALAAIMRGHNAVALDINPFLIWFAKAKVAEYHRNSIERARDAAVGIIQDMPDPADPPPIANIERWWGKNSLDFLCRVKAGIDSLRMPAEKTLLLIAFCRTQMALSNAAFNHQSMSFNDKSRHDRQLKLFSVEPDYSLQFLDDVEVVLEGALINPSGKAEILNVDARDCAPLSRERFDLLITSPPYPNRMSYIRELRPYMYWLGFLQDARKAGELDWKAIGGTWGIATSLLADWQMDKRSYLPDYLLAAIDGVARAERRHSRILANYIAKYFVDMWKHLTSILPVMKNGGSVYYIVGNSTFYDVLIPVERAYADMLSKAGFSNVSVETIRKRNSKKALFEYAVTGTAQQSSC